MTSTKDLKDVTNQSDWFATIAMPAPSNLDDSQARFELDWRNALAASFSSASSRHGGPSRL